MRDDAKKSREQLVEEIAKLRQQVAYLEIREADQPQGTDVSQADKNQIRLLYENIPLSYQGLDQDGRIITVNNSWLTTLGYTRDAVIGRCFSDFLIPAIQDRFREKFPDFKNGGDVHDTEWEMLRQDGTQIIVILDGLIEYDSQGRFKQTHCVLRDVTARKQAEKMLHESKARLRKNEQLYKSQASLARLLADNVPDLVWAKDLAGRFIFVNKAMCEKLLNARDVDEPIGKTDMFFAKRERESHPDDPQWHTFGETCITSDQVVLGSKQPERFDDSGNVQGKFIYLDTYKAPFWDAQGEMIGTVGSARIVTREKRLEEERRQVEEALRRRNQELDLLNQAQQAFNSSLDLDQVLAAVLNEVRRLLEITASSIWLNDLTTDALICRQVTEPQSQVIRGWKLEKGQGIGGWVAQTNQSIIVSDAQVDERHFGGVDQKTGLETRSLLCVPLRVRQQVIGVLQVMDIVVDRFQTADRILVESLAATAAVAIENARLHERLANHAADMEQRVAARTGELVIANAQLKELDRLKTKLIEDISHELRTPVANLSLYLDLLERGKPERRDHYKIVLREKTDQLTRLIEDVLDVFRLDLFKGDVVFERLDLNKIVAEVLHSYRGRAEIANLDISFEFGGDLPFVLVEKKQIQQVVTNLLDNAIKYTVAGSVQISAYFDAAREQICLRVEDSGMGIPAEELPHIFDRFYRGRHVGQLTVPGTGLGLAVVKDITALHGGAVEVESVMDKGSVFRVWLPVAKDGQGGD